MASKKRKVLTLEERIQVIKLLESERISHLMSTFCRDETVVLV